MGNELKLSLENFQSISNGELIFHTGTNVIIGQSNSGKTATFRGLKACLSNPTGSQRFIKKGTKQASVILEYNGNQIIWKRTPKESSYTINGEDFIKTGKSNAFKIIEDTGFVIDDNDVIMNIEEELQLPFPFGISKAELFKLYENVFCVSDSAVILKAAKEQEETTKNQITTLENEITKNQNKLIEIQSFKEEVDLDSLEEKKELLRNKSERINFLQEGLPAIHRAARVENFKVEEITFENKSLDLQEKKDLKIELCRLKELHGLNKSLKDSQEPVPQGLEQYKELRNLHRTYTIIRKLEGTETPVKEFLSKLEAYKELSNLRQTLKTLQNLKGLEAPVEEFVNKLQEYEELLSYSKTLRNLKEKIRAKKEELKKVEILMNNAEEALKEYKVCPLCHQPLNN